MLLAIAVACLALLSVVFEPGASRAAGATNEHGTSSFRYDVPTDLAHAGGPGRTVLVWPAVRPAGYVTPAGGISGHAYDSPVSFVAPSPTAGSIRNVNPTGSGTNCVNCVVAPDATLAGRPASALPSGPQPISVLEDVFGGTFKPVAGQSEITALMTDAGARARGVVFGSRGSEVGRVFNVVNQGGTVRFLDGQTGGVASFSGFDGFEFMLIPG